MTLHRTLLLLAAGIPFATAMAVDAPAQAPAGAGADAVLQAVVAGDWRSADDKARDADRHPVAALGFWGLAPGMTILEIYPGGGWWSDILAPFAHRTGGRFYFAGPDLGDPELSDGARKARAKLEARFAAKPEVFGTVGAVNWGPKSAPLPANSYDFILTARSVHGWMRNPGMVEKAFSDFHGALKPGGMLAVEQHRANPGPQDPTAASGYVTEAFVIEQAEKAGFRLAGRSELNANPRDTKDHPFGVWTLPPSLRTTPYGSAQGDPAFDQSKYVAIGESDRMTLRFVKPQ